MNDKTIGVPSEVMRNNTPERLAERAKVHPSIDWMAEDHGGYQLVTVRPLAKVSGYLAEMLIDDYGWDASMLQTKTDISLGRCRAILKGEHVKDPSQHLTFDELIRIAIAANLSLDYVIDTNRADLLRMTSMSEASLKMYDALIERRKASSHE